MKTVIILAHPNMRESIYNKTLIEALQRESLKQVEIRDLYKLYPDFNIDIKAEQKALMQADKIILQSPVYWYNYTPLLKKWMDDVFEHGWAYGTNGDKLNGKIVGYVLTAGGSEEDYQEVQPELPSLEACFNFMKHTVALVGGTLMHPYIVYGASYGNNTQNVQPAIPGYIEYIKK